MYGERIRELRKEKNMTLRELANELGIPFTTLGNYEREDREPSFETLEAIANFFNVSIDFLAGRKAERTDEFLLNSNIKRIQEQLNIAPPKIREKVIDIFDQLFLITGDELSEQNLKELELLNEIVYFVLNMKNEFTLSKSRNGFIHPANKYEFARAYHREKNQLDKSFNELFEIYAEKRTEWSEE